jgi:hypothetical protein
MDRGKYSLQLWNFPLYSVSTAQAREKKLRDLSGFFVARITILGGALFGENAHH